MSNHDPFVALSTSFILMVKDELDAQLQGSHIGPSQIVVVFSCFLAMLNKHARWIQL